MLDDSIAFALVSFLFVAVFLKTTFESLDFLLIAACLFLERAPFLPFFRQMALQFFALRSQELGILPCCCQLFRQRLLSTTLLAAAVGVDLHGASAALERDLERRSELFEEVFSLNFKTAFGVRIEWG